MTRWRRSRTACLLIAMVGCNGLLENGNGYLDGDGSDDGRIDTAAGGATTSSTTSGGAGGGGVDREGGDPAIDGAADMGTPEPADTSTAPPDASADSHAADVVAREAGDDRREASMEASTADVAIGTDTSTPVTCRKSVESPKVDPNTGHSWSPVWYCANDHGAALFEGANSRAQIGYMTTIDSWFVCFRHGEAHRGGDDVWYYTQGDGSLPGWESRHAWGYMPSFYVRTSSNPFPGIPECTANP